MTDPRSRLLDHLSEALSGEGTSRAYYGNVHAAVLTGLREARRLGVERFAVAGWEDW
jgi:hypothetical protein